jgi:ABC-type amino acid transport substrate-binding protein
MTYDTELDAVQALLDGTVVAYLGNANFVSQYPDLLQESSARLPSAEQGIAVALDHPNTTAAVQASLGEMINDGTYLQILRRYLPAQSVDNFSIIEAP